MNNHELYILYDKRRVSPSYKVYEDLRAQVNAINFMLTLNNQDRAKQ